MIYTLLDFITPTEASIKEVNSQDKHERKKKKSKPEVVTKSLLPMPPLTEVTISLLRDIVYNQIYIFSLREIPTKRLL